MHFSTSFPLLRHFRPEKLLVPLVWFLIGFFYVNFWMLFAFPLQEDKTQSEAYSIWWPLILSPSVLLFHLLAIFTVGSYWLACNIHPNGSESTLSPTKLKEKFPSQEYTSEHELERSKEVSIFEHKQNVNIRERYWRKFRWCVHCEIFKPPRAHHCSNCNRCCLKFDHCCPWVGQCVGHYNHKAFILFLFYVSVAMSFLASLSLKTILEYWLCPSCQFYLSIYQHLILAINLILIVLFVPQTIILFINQMDGVCKNTTKVELWLVHWAKRDAKLKNQDYFYPYDHGILKNLYEFFGRSVFIWFLPTTEPVQDGLGYPDLFPDEQRSLLFENSDQTSTNSFIV